jgi:hypothetical protein
MQDLAEGVNPLCGEIAFRPVDKAQANTSNNEPKPEELLKKKKVMQIFEDFRLLS